MTLKFCLGNGQALLETMSDILVYCHILGLVYTLQAIYSTSLIYCNCIVTRGGVYDEIWPEPKGNPEGGARGIS